MCYEGIARIRSPEIPVQLPNLINQRLKSKLFDRSDASDLNSRALASHASPKTVLSGWALAKRINNYAKVLKAP